nr:immunoglobulin heavy chain junction region [Mus musculus]
CARSDGYFHYFDYW